MLKYVYSVEVDFLNKIVTLSNIHISFNVVVGTDQPVPKLLWLKLDPYVSYYHSVSSQPWCQPECFTQLGMVGGFHQANSFPTSNLTTNRVKMAIGVLSSQGAGRFNSMLETGTF